MPLIFPSCGPSLGIESLGPSLGIVSRGPSLGIVSLGFLDTEAFILLESQRKLGRRHDVLAYIPLVPA